MTGAAPLLRTPNEYATIALEVARRAGQLALTGFRNSPATFKKRAVELVTEYDLASERLLRELLAEKTPECAIVGEEAGGDPGSGLTWYCDPIDGTTNFVHGHPFWAVSVGLMHGDTALVGAVVAPSLGLEWWGGEGIGAFRGDTQARVSNTDTLCDAVVATGFPSAPDASPDNNFAAFERVQSAVHGVRRCGSAAIDVCLVADGTYDAYWERIIAAWDVAGGTAVALAAGARVTSLDGGAADLRRGHVLVSNGVLHDALLALAR